MFTKACLLRTLQAVSLIRLATRDVRGSWAMIEERKLSTTWVNLSHVQRSARVEGQPKSLKLRSEFFCPPTLMGSYEMFYVPVHKSPLVKEREREKHSLLRSHDLNNYIIPLLY